MAFPDDLGGRTESGIHLGLRPMETAGVGVEALLSALRPKRWPAGTRTHGGHCTMLSDQSSVDDSGDRWGRTVGERERLVINLVTHKCVGDWVWLLACG